MVIERKPLDTDTYYRAVKKARDVFDCPHCGVKKGQQCKNVGHDEIHKARFPEVVSSGRMPVEMFLDVEPTHAKLDDIAPLMFAQHIPTLRIPKELKVPDVEWEKLNIKLPRHRVIVEMLETPESRNGILLTDLSRKVLRPHMGVVLASDRSDDYYQGVTYKAPQKGTLVICRPKDGTWITDADMGYKPKGEVRSYGVYGEFPGNPQSMYWWDSIIAEYNEGMVRPYGDKIVFKVDEGKDREGSIILLNKKSTAMATAVAVGPFERDVKVGDRVCFDPYHIEQVGVLVDDVVDSSLCIGSALSIVYVLENEVAA